MTYEYQSIRWMADHWLSSQATPEKRFKENSELREKSEPAIPMEILRHPKKLGELQKVQKIRGWILWSRTI